MLMHQHVTACRWSPAHTCDIINDSCTISAARSRFFTAVLCCLDPGGADSLYLSEPGRSHLQEAAVGKSVAFFVATVRVFAVAAQLPCPAHTDFSLTTNALLDFLEVCSILQNTLETNLNSAECLPIILKVAFEPNMLPLQSETIL